MSGNIKMPYEVEENMNQAPVPLITHIELGRMGINEPELPVVAKVRMAQGTEHLEHPWEDVVAIASSGPDENWEVDPVASGYETAAIIWQHNLSQVTEAMKERVGDVDQARALMEKLENMSTDVLDTKAEDEYEPGGYI